MSDGKTHRRHVIELTSSRNAEVLDEVEHGFDLDQRTSRNICKAPEFLSATTADAFGQIQHDAITSTTPLIRQVSFGFREPIDERARQYGKASRVLVEHMRGVASSITKTPRHVAFRRNTPLITAVRLWRLGVFSRLVRL